MNQPIEELKARLDQLIQSLVIVNNERINLRSEIVKVTQQIEECEKDNANNPTNE